MEGDCGDTLDDTKLLKSRSMATSDTSEFLTSNEDISPSPCNVECPSTTDFSPSSSSMFVSARIEQMMQTRSEYASEVEFETEASKDHWSQVESDDARDEVTSETNKEIFQSLQKEWGGFFHDYGDSLKVGRKIAEGGQAEIYEVHIEYPNGNKVEYALKVFKEGYSLRDLQKQWPDGMLQKIDGGILTRKGYFLYDGTLLQDGRFAFSDAEMLGRFAEAH